MGKRLLMLAIVLAAPAMLGLVGQVALGQTRRTPPKPHAAGRASAAKGDGGTDIPTAGTLAPTSTGTAPSVAPTATWDAGAVVESRTVGDGGTHVFKFSELDIEGRLKSPQLVYFLRRVRAEFSAGELGHRSFMREMSETRKEGSFQ
ncbi:MAG TPA: hypothetical protein VMI75_34980 [Polyangiaceae bacterium]|nr:hypothetical protein [Polyangiaceae bacterium]